MTASKIKTLKDVLKDEMLKISFKNKFLKESR